MNYQPVTAGNQTNPSACFQDKFDVEKAEEEIDQQYVLFPVWSSGTTNPHNNDRDAAFDGKEPDIDAKKPEFEVSVSPSSKFEDCSDNIINEVNAAGTIVPTVGHNSPNSTNKFSVASPSNAAASPTYGKSSFIDAFQLPDDPDMPELEDITYSDDEDDVGAEADFNNLETSITVSPIPTTRVHKDHHVSQTIGDLSSTNQTRSMAKVVKDQGFENPDHPEKVYKVVKELYGLHQAPRACQDKYIAKILRKFGLTKGKSASTPIDTEKPLLKDPDGKDVDVHTYSDYAGAGLDIKFVGNKMHKAFPLLGESSHWQYKFLLPVEGVPTARRMKIPLPRYKFPLPVEGVPTARRMEIPLPRVCTAMMKKLPVKENWQLH
nr:hypothetical protein [Tanacetum cinerariifolium]